MKRSLILASTLLLSSALFAEEEAKVTPAAFRVEIFPFGGYGGYYYGSPYYSCPPGYYYRYGYYGPQCYSYGPGYGYYYRGPYNRYYYRRH